MEANGGALIQHESGGGWVLCAFLRECLSVIQIPLSHRGALESWPFDKVPQAAVCFKGGNHVAAGLSALHWVVAAEPTNLFVLVISVSKNRYEIAFTEKYAEEFIPVYLVIDAKCATALRRATSPV